MKRLLLAALLAGAALPTCALAGTPYVVATQTNASTSATSITLTIAHDIAKGDAILALVGTTVTLSNNPTDSGGSTYAPTSAMASFNSSTDRPREYCAKANAAMANGVGTITLSGIAAGTKEVDFSIIAVNGFSCPIAGESGNAPQNVAASAFPVTTVAIPAGALVINRNALVVNVGSSVLNLDGTLTDIPTATTQTTGWLMRTGYATALSGTPTLTASLAAGTKLGMAGYDILRPLINSFQTLLLLGVGQ